MGSRRARRVRSCEDGFTLIEVSVVMLMIAILIAIAVPTFLTQRSKGQDAEAKSELSNAGPAAMTYYTDHESFSGLTTAGLKDIEPSLKGGAAGTGLSVESASGEAYELHLTHPDTGHTFTLSRAAGKDTRTCTPAGEGGCPASGNW